MIFSITFLIINAIFALSTFAFGSYICLTKSSRTSIMFPMAFSMARMLFVGIGLVFMIKVVQVSGTALWGLISGLGIEIIMILILEIVGIHFGTEFLKKKE